MLRDVIVLPLRAFYATARRFSRAIRDMLLSASAIMLFHATFTSAFDVSITSLLMFHIFFRRDAADVSEITLLLRQVIV